MSVLPAPLAAAKTISTKVHIACEIEAVWAVLTGFAAYASWNPYLVRIEGEARAGAALRVQALSLGAARPVLQHIEVVSLVPYGMRWQAGAADRAELACDHRFELEATGPRATLFKHCEHFTGSRIGEFGSYHEATITRNFLRFNQALRSRCEGRPAAGARGA